MDMEQILTERWESALADAWEAVKEAEQHLGWVANVYSGQLSLELLKDDVRNSDGNQDRSAA